MTVPCFQFWRLRVTENYGGDTVKIDAISFLGRSGGDPISIDGEAIANAGDASGAFSGGSGWVINSRSGEEYFALGGAAGSSVWPSSHTMFISQWSDYSITQSVEADSISLATGSVKISPDASMIAATTFYDEISIVDTSTWTVTKTLVGTVDFGSRQLYSSIAWSPDSRYFAITGDDNNAVLVFDSQNSWAQVYTGTYAPSGYSPGIWFFYQLDWSPDGQYLVAANYDYEELVVFNTSDWTHFSVTTPEFLPNLASRYTGAAFSRDGLKLYAVSNRTPYGSANSTLHVIDVATWTQTDSVAISISGLGGTFFHGVYVSPDDNYLVTVAETTPTLFAIQLFDLTGSSPVRIPVTLEAGRDAEIYETPSIAWKPDSSEFLFVSGNATPISVAVPSGVTSYVSSITSEVGSVLYSIDAAPAPPPPAPPGGAAIGYKFALPVTPSHIEITASGTSRPKTGVIEYSGDGRTWYPLQTIGFD